MISPGPRISDASILIATSSEQEKWRHPAVRDDAVLD